MRSMYADNPHSFYLPVCRKYNIKPLAEIKEDDVYAMVYGKAMFDKVKAIEDEENEEQAARIAKEIVEAKDPSEDESESVSGSESDSKSSSKSEAKEDEKDEMWPSKSESRRRMKIDIPRDS